MAASKQEKLFVQHYISNGFNARQAMLSAGYSDGNASSHSAALIKKKDVRQHIELLLGRVARRCEVT